MSRDAKWYANWIRLLPASTPDEKMRNLEAADMLEQLEAAQPKWISVEERLPDVEVLAANFAPGTYGYKEYIIGYVSGEKCTEPGKCHAENDYEILYNVTHWMPLPEPPKEEA